MNAQTRVAPMPPEHAAAPDLHLFPARLAATRPDAPTAAAARSFAKRSIDVCGAAVGLLIAGLPMLVLALLIRLDSRGPALFRQRRLGLDGRAFWVLKFRTMTSDAEEKLSGLESLNESDGVLFKIRRDPRITRIGSLLRRTSVDELPQLFNVLRGEMSLVGPRPLQLRDCEKLRDLDPDGYARRLSVPPGLTGMWQVGGRSDVHGDGMLRLDLEYVDRWSLALDLRILCRTVGVVLACRGAC